MPTQTLVKLRAGPYVTTRNDTKTQNDLGK